MKIGIMGAPGAGKSKFARKLSAKLVEDSFSKPFILDKYVESLQKKVGYAMGGVAATYPQNYQILFHRWTLEQEAAHRGVENLIACGTMYDTFTWAYLRANLEEQTTSEKMVATLQARAALTAMGMLESLMFEYEVFLWLPYTQKKEEEEGQSYNAVANRKLPEIAQGYFKDFIVLDGNEKENVEFATKQINTVSQEVAQPTTYDQLSVRGSRAEDSAESQEQ